MNKDTVQGDWTNFKGKVKEKWGKLTDDDWKVIEGERDQLSGLIQKRYGLAKEEVQKNWTKCALVSTAINELTANCLKNSTYLKLSE